MDEGSEEATLHIGVECPGADEDAINITELQMCVRLRICIATGLTRYSRLHHAEKYTSDFDPWWTEFQFD